MINTKIDTSYLNKALSKYKIPKSLINIAGNLIIIKLPDVGTISSMKEIDDLTNTEVLKIKNDLKSGKYKPDRLVSYSIADYYSSDNGITLVFAVEKVVTNPKILYHWTKNEYVDNILKGGLKAMKGDWKVGSGGSGAVTYKAIFLLEKPGILSKNPGFRQYKRPKYSLLEIEMPRNIDIWKDPHYFAPDPSSYMVYKDIPPSNITLKEK